jgi:predicted nucleic acid-binding protein
VPAGVPVVPHLSLRPHVRFGPIVIVVDASVLVTALADDGRDGDRARARLAGQRLAAPQIVDLEVASVLRRLTRTGQVPQRRADLALTDLIALPIERAPHLPLLQRCWELRANVTVYDAAYVALAEALGVAFLTSDTKLARAAGTHCPIELIPAP